MRILTTLLIFLINFSFVNAQILKEELGVRPWRVPNFSQQDTALGYSPDVFSTPKEMETQVQFWIDIYTKYSSTEAVIHDKDYVDLVYRVIDLNGVESEKQKQKKVDEAKKEIIEQLKKISTVTDASLLNDEDKKIWNYFVKLNATSEVIDSKKIIEAATMDRIRYQSGLKDRMQTAIFLSGRYLEQMEQIFKAEGIPIEITRLVFVESSFNIFARSKVGASGLWQIMPSVAKPYGYIKSTYDKRNLPIEATKLAAKILKNNFKLLGTWPLAITGYNHGPNGIKRIVEKHKTQSLAQIIDLHTSHTFRFASKNFYASFLAALSVERNAAKYFADPQWAQALNPVEFKLTKEIYFKDLELLIGGNEVAQVFNPHFSRQIRKNKQQIPAGTVVFVSEEKKELLAELMRQNSKIRTLASRNEKPTRTESVEVGPRVKAD